MARSPSEAFTMFGVTFRRAQIIRAPSADYARRRAIRSRALACVVPLPLLALLSWAGVGLLTSVALAIASAYITWASYWVLSDVAGTSPS